MNLENLPIKLTETQLQIVDCEDRFLQWVLKDRRTGVTTAIAIKAIQKAIAGVPVFYVHSSSLGLNRFVQTVAELCHEQGITFSVINERIVRIGDTKISCVLADFHAVSQEVRGSYNSAFIALDEISILDASQYVRSLSAIADSIFIVPYFPGKDSPIFALNQIQNDNTP